MSTQFSTGLRNDMLVTGSLKSLMDGGFLKFYSGPVPASADAALDGANTLLCTISNNGTGTGLTLATSASGGTVAKNASEVWKGTNSASGAASFVRFVKSSDTGAASITERRIQGLVDVVGAEANLSNVVLTSGAEQLIDSCVFALPTY